MYDRETELYYLQSRYYDPEMGRFLNADGYTTTGQGFLGSNMFAYCQNNPVVMKDSTGRSTTKITLIAILGASLSLYSLISNVSKAVLYEFASEKSNLTSSSYTTKKPTVLEKLSYVKQQTGEEHYNLNAWRYYNEYTVHEYGWYLTGWADKKDILLISALAKSSSDAEVKADEWDHRWYINVVTVFFGLLGL